MAVAGLRRWQSEAIEAWRGNGYRGIVGAVTGGGKTIFALACIRETSPETTLIVVPTVALLDQWWEEATSYFGLRLDDINIITGRAKLAPRHDKHRRPEHRFQDAADLDWQPDDARD